MDIVNILSELSNADLNEAKDISFNYLRQILPNCEKREGYIIGWSDSGKKKLIVDAHIDQVGFIVTYITSDGFLYLEKVGGIDARILPATEICVCGKEKIHGIVTAIPPHLAKKDVSDSGKIYLDCGFNSKAEAIKRVNLGDTAYFATSFKKLHNGCLTGKSLDDRAGVAVVLHALKKLKNDNLKFDPVVIFSDMEEIGERGAKIAARNIQADYAVAVDVSFAASKGEKVEKCGKLHKGAMIGVSPSLSKKVSDRLIAIAYEKSINHQIEVMPALTSTNADQYSAVGIPSATISIPLRYMHTPVEVVNSDDLHSAVDLLTGFLKWGCDDV